ncbi:unnamed protein product [Leptosia nina]|uniref:Uncharacterized protein n=1 Tax=Leptosia nina TaxID=320188 RepID=A0AAV1J3I5_9NEOP
MGRKLKSPPQILEAYPRYVDSLTSQDLAGRGLSITADGKPLDRGEDIAVAMCDAFRMGSSVFTHFRI